MRESAGKKERRGPYEGELPGLGDRLGVGSGRGVWLESQLFGPGSAA